jgi:hypothetical protein
MARFAAAGAVEFIAFLAIRKECGVRSAIGMEINANYWMERPVLIAG